MPSHRPSRYIRHTHHPSTDFESAYQDISSALGAGVKHVQNHVPKTRKIGSVYVGITGSASMTYHLSAQVLPGLSPAELLAFTDARLMQALSLSPTSLSSPSSGSHSSFLETAVGIATLTLERAIEHASTTNPASVGPFTNSWSSCAQLIKSATEMAVSDDRRRGSDEDDGCEVLYGRAGLVYALLRLRNASRHHEINKADAVDLLTTVRALSSTESISLLVHSIICRGESGAARYATQLAGSLPAPPLMWTWHWKRYLGAAHGVAGILHILLLCPADIVQPYMSSILRTVEWLIGCQDAHGNWPTAAPTGIVAETSSKEVVQWCHGASGILILLCTVLRCSTPISSPHMLEKVIASVQAGAELVYKHGFLSKGVGLCHGVAGSVFALLAVSDVLDRARNRTDTNNEDNYYLQRAVHLAQLATGHDALTARGEMRVPDHPLSLYEGLAGMCCAWAEVLERLVASERLNFGKERLKVEKQRQFDRSGMPGFDDVKGDTWASW